MKLLEKLDSYSKSKILLIGSLQIGILAVVDYLTGFELSFSLFYLIPVALIAWYCGRQTGTFTAIVSAVIWQVVNLEAGQEFSNHYIPIWNALTRLGFFIIVTYLLTELKKSFQYESRLARTDYLTGAANPRSFYETAGNEINRAKRYGNVFSLCYLDADNFKQINDTLGHHVGSELLVKVVKIIKENLRSSDVIARVGGDEFAILLPETNQRQARSAINKIREKLQEEMEKQNWLVTFSIGVLTCIETPGTVDDLIKNTDALMYEVKKNGKNSVKYKELTEEIKSTKPNSVLITA